MLLVPVLLAALALAPGLHAQAVWTAVTGDWTASENWQDGLVPDNSTDASIFNGGTATLSGSGAATTLYLGNDQGNGSLTLASGADFSTGAGNLGASGGTGSVLVSGGAWSLSDNLYVGANAGTGSLTITSGSVTVGGTWPSVMLRVGNGTDGNGSVTISGGTLTADAMEVGSNSGGTGTFTIDGGAVSMANQASVGVVGSTGTLTLNAGTFSTGQLFIGVGGGTTTVNLNGGVLTTQKITGDSGFGSGTLTFNGGTIQAAANQATFLTGFVSTTVQIDAGGATIDTQNFTIGISPVLHGTGDLTKKGTGTLTLTGANTYAGATVVQAGTLSVATLANGGANSPIGSSSSAAGSLVLDGGTLRYTGSSVTTDRLFSAGTGGGSINVSTANQTLTLSNPGSMGFNGQSGARTLTLTGAGNGALAAVIGDNGGATALAKTGTGTWTLSGVSTYSGATAVSVGTLKVTGSIGASSLTTVGSGATLTGNGTVGALTIASGGTLAPGNSPGTLSAGDTTFSGGGRLIWEINSVGSGNNLAGQNPGWDLLSIDGSLDLAADAGNRFTVNLTSLTTGNTAGEVADFDADSSYFFTFVHTTDGVQNFSADAFDLNFDGFANSFAGTWTVEQSGNDLNLVYSVGAIPEPATWAALAGLGALAFATWRRRGKRRMV